MKKPANSIDKTIKELTDQLKEITDRNKQVLEVIDLSLPYNHMFTPAAKKGMSKKVMCLLPERKVSNVTTLQMTVMDKVEYFGTVVIGEEKLVKAGRKVAELINRYAEKGYITGCLAPLGAIKLATEPHELDRYVVFCYVSMTKEGSELIEREKPKMRIGEGNQPEDITN